jgi:hypothetical protein
MPILYFNSIVWQEMFLLFRSVHQDTRLGASCKTGRICRNRPDAGLKKSKECLRLLDAREVELENHVGRIIMGLMDAAGCYARRTSLCPAKRSNAAFQVAKSRILCSMCSVAIDALTLPNCDQGCCAAIRLSTRLNLNCDAAPAPFIAMLRP